MDERRIRILLSILVGLLPAIVTAVISRYVLHTRLIWPGVLVALSQSPTVAKCFYDTITLRRKKESRHG